MVVYITPAEGNGGILQFSTTITRETKKFCDFQLFVRIRSTINFW